MISEGFVRNGAKVYISSRDASACERTVSELNGIGRGKAFAIPADFYKVEDCKRLAEELGKREKSELLFCCLDIGAYFVNGHHRAACASQQFRLHLGRTIRGLP